MSIAKKMLSMLRYRSRIACKAVEKLIRMLVKVQATEKHVMRQCQQSSMDRR
jgi:hypothetical protein